MCVRVYVCVCGVYVWCVYVCVCGVYVWCVCYGAELRDVEISRLSQALEKDRNWDRVQVRVRTCGVCGVRVGSRASTWPLRPPLSSLTAHSSLLIPHSSPQLTCAHTSTVS